MPERDYVRLFFGKSFTGKTSRMFEEIRAEKRVILLDPKCGSLTRLPGWEHLWPYYDEQSCRWLGKTFTDYFRKHLRKPFRVVVHQRDFHEQQLDMLCRMLMAMRDCTLAIDELAEYVPPGSPESLPRYTKRAVISGRHEGLRFYGAAQRPSFVHATVRANASAMSFYRMTEPVDLKIAARYFPKEIASQIFSLPDYVCAEWSDAHAPFVNESLRGKFGAPGAK